MKFTRKDFMSSAAAFAVSPMLAADGSQIKTPLMLDTKRMAIHDGPGIRTTFFVKPFPAANRCCSGNGRSSFSESSRKRGFTPAWTPRFTRRLRRIVRGMG